MKRNRWFSPQVMDLMSAGTMIPACILVSWLVYTWMHGNGWVGEGAEIWFVIFGIGTGFYNFFRMIKQYDSRKSGKSGNGKGD